MQRGILSSTARRLAARRDDEHGATLAARADGGGEPSDALAVGVDAQRGRRAVSAERTPLLRPALVADLVALAGAERADDACADPFWTLLACRFRRSPYPDAMFDGRAHSLVRVFESYTRASRSTRYNGHLSFLRRCTVVLLVYESEYFCLSVDFHGHAFLSARLFQAPP